MTGVPKEIVIAHHIVLWRVREHLLANGAPPSAFDSYEAHGCRPNHLWKESSAHIRALGLLAGAIDELVAPTQTRVPLGTPRNRSPVANIRSTPGLRALAIEMEGFH